MCVELVEDVNDRHALVPSNEGWDVGDLELVCNVCVKHAEACAPDVLIQLVFILEALEHVNRGFDCRRGGILCIYCHRARISWYRESC